MFTLRIRIKKTSGQIHMGERCRLELKIAGIENCNVDWIDLDFFMQNSVYNRILRKSRPF